MFLTKMFIFLVNGILWIFTLLQESICFVCISNLFQCPDFRKIFSCFWKTCYEKWRESFS